MRSESEEAGCQIRAYVRGRGMDSGMDKVLTVIVPVYNMEKYIRQYLESLVIGEVLDQIEVLDGSKDGSAEIAYEFVEQYPDTFRIIYKANGGHGSAINTGLMMASDEYVKILDSDDWVERDAFCRLVDCLETEGTDIVWSNYYWVYEMNGEKAIQYRDPFPEVVYGKKYRFRDIADKTFIKMHSMTIRTEPARQAGRKIDENCYCAGVEFVMYPITEVEPSLSGTGGIKQGIRKSRIVLYSFYSDFSTSTSRELSSGIIIQNRTNSPSRHWKEEQSRIIMPCLMQASNTS